MNLKKKTDANKPTFTKTIQRNLKTQRSKASEVKYVFFLKFCYILQLPQDLY